MKKIIRIIPLLLILLMVSISTVGASGQQPRTLTVNKLIVSSSQARPGEPLTVTWETNADYVYISWFGFRNSVVTACSGVEGHDPLVPACPPSGTASIPEGVDISFLAVLDFGTENEQRFHQDISITCDPDAWFFETSIEKCPTEMPRLGTIFHQQFEHGVMVQSSHDPSIVHVLFGTNLANGETSNFLQFRTDDFPETDPLQVQYAPNNRFVPTGLFGRIWQQPDVKEQLGWALEGQATSYDGYHQQFSDVAGLRQYISSPTPNRIFAITSIWFSVNWAYQTVNITACEIPTSGPWPPCATDGATAAPAATTPSNGNCVIPVSGPWPTCATQGNNPPPNTADCVVPTSGRWPACARNGNGQSATNSCVIPASGPWPTCATQGNNPPADTADCVVPASGPWPACAR